MSNQILTHRPLHQSIPVTFNYQVHFTTGLFELDNPILASVIKTKEQTHPKLALVVVDSGVILHHPQLLSKLEAYADHYQDVLRFNSEPIIVTGGEVVKNETGFVEKIHQKVNEAGICRHSYVIAIGGGAVLDMAGYAAATAHRGVRLIRVPTTVLAQNDSGVGVKNGINAFGKKNFLGTFMPPYAVLNDFDFLTTLDDRDWRSGIAEAIKVALLKDPDFFHFIYQQAHKLAGRHMDVMQHLVYHCAQLHLNHIAGYGDPFEMGSSRPLDFGHWSAHKLEQLTNYELRHGEAVAIGIALDSTYSYLSGLLSESVWQQILDTLKALGFSLYAPQLEAHLDNPNHPDCVFRGLTEFREHLGGQLTIMLLEDIGQGKEVHEVDLSLYKQAVLQIKAFEGV